MIADAVNQPTQAEQEREQRRQQLCKLRIKTDTEVCPEEPALSVDGVGFFTLDDIHAIKGKQKCGKTSALKVCAAALLAGQQFRVKSELEAARVLYLDTEQKQADVKLIVSDVAEMTGLDASYIDEHLAVYALRRRDYNLLKDDLLLLTEDFRPQVVIIDGIVEFVASFNDESLAKELIHDLLTMSEDYHCAVVCVLHTNKADEDHNMRGHLGSMLGQKACTVLECKKLQGIISVKCTDARHAEMPEWNIMFSADGQLLDADEQMGQLREQRKAELQQQRQQKNDLKVKERTETTLRLISDNGGSMERKELTNQLVERLKLERTTVSKFITQLVNDRTLFEADKVITNSPQTVLPF